MRLRASKDAVGPSCDRRLLIVAYASFRALAPKIQAPSPLPANSVCTAFLRTAGFQSVELEPRDFDLDIACGGGIEGALETAMALGPTYRALQDQGAETRAAIARSIRRALQPYQRGQQVALAGAIWLVTANNA
jgi:hypothetical protein